ncbi:MAG: hypothetical protein CVV56_08525 [Tenericutes bacterium HGW-Tenericutes-1]|jgi:hypothetical protein|nr:MAG: hypothetical protein CVV56_08525 [Tenericutes bacterium HGW-Tenericutes-1]
MALFETIKYKVIKKDKKIEIRQYEDIYLASTKTNVNPNLDSGFMNVFRYISGSNDQEAKISMTTPVVTYEENQQLVTGFYVPSKYKKASIPKPNEDQVFINELKKSYYAVIRFSGSWTKSNFDKQDQLLLDYIKTNKLIIASNRLILRYQPPFVPSFLRRNEIAYQIEAIEESLS